MRKPGLLGTGWRQEHTERAWTAYREFKRSGTKMPTSSNGYWNDAYCCLLMGLVVKVGWKPVEQAIQSYNDYPPRHVNNLGGDERKKTQTRDFLERLSVIIRASIGNWCSVSTVRCRKSLRLTKH